ncbi:MULTISPECIES: Rossmann-fold NAD(P)-binding domain-containing protein [Streptomyces]|uniref:NAD(P)H azoreductase n=1 Tax=Streptomyces rubrolavendulae TaxID=285473 RepID=A0A1D8G9E3_9ACTN|nr:MULTISPECIES: NmrA family transcriptional regulator [Streptomyces]AOT62071.1 NAD(P)H azoreductase [Streptomyces rubrolavendulae]UQS29770.1 NmrA family transcriptional regulator [Streptomyces fradiae]
MTTNTDVTTVLVTAATGKTGRRVVERLAGRGLEVRAGSRGGGTPFDWERPETWGPALDGADLVYVAYYPDLAAPGAAEALGAFGRLAAAAGARRVVLLSGRGEAEAVAAEEALRDALGGGVELAVVRAAFFVQNFTEGFLAEGAAAGEFAFPAGAVAEPFVDAGDVADVVVAALTEDGHAGAVHEVTGPRPLTFAEAAAEIGALAGREVRYVPVSAERYAAELAGHGWPEEQAAWLAGLFASLLDGHNASATDGVRRVLGREPRGFAEALGAAPGPLAPGAVA